MFAGRPAVKALSQPSEDDEALVAGYLVERGYALSLSHPDPSHDVIDSTWHWRGFERCLSEPSLRKHLADLMNDFAPHERVIWIVTERAVGLRNELIPYDGMSTLDKVKASLDTAPSDRWVSVMCGVRFQREQCLAFSEVEILREFSRLLVQAHKIAAVVESAVPSQ
jgi:hypothetical protein